MSADESMIGLFFLRFLLFIFPIGSAIHHRGRVDQCHGTNHKPRNWEKKAWRPDTSIKYENSAHLIDCPSLDFRHADRVSTKRSAQIMKWVWTPLFRGRGRKGKLEGRESK